MFSSGARDHAVLLHVYEFDEVGERTQRALASLNLGIYHTGVEVSAEIKFKFRYSAT